MLKEKFKMYKNAGVHRQLSGSFAITSSIDSIWVLKFSWRNMIYRPKSKI